MGKTKKQVVRDTSSNTGEKSALSKKSRKSNLKVTDVEKDKSQIDKTTQENSATDQKPKSSNSNMIDDQSLPESKDQTLNETKQVTIQNSTSKANHSNARNGNFHSSTTGN